MQSAFDTIISQARSICGGAWLVTGTVSRKGSHGTTDTACTMVSDCGIDSRGKGKSCPSEKPGFPSEDVKGVTSCNSNLVTCGYRLRKK